MTIAVTGLPPLAWTGADGIAAVDDERQRLELTAMAGVDWTNDAAGGPQQHRATALAFAAPAGDFVLSARVAVKGERTTFDAGALVLWSDEDHWAKLCFEYSPQGSAMVVSVVTEGFSDDCNSHVVREPAVYLRIARTGASFAFHSSRDGATWEFVRTFRLAPGGEPWKIGFLSQAPMGQQCVADFDHIAFEERTLADLRDGS